MPKKLLTFFKNPRVRQTAKWLIPLVVTWALGRLNKQGAKKQTKSKRS